MSALKLLQSANSIHDLAHLLGYKPAALGYVAYGLKGSSRYNTFDIPKRSGGLRTISAPSTELKALQRRLVAYLQRCIDEIDKGSPKKRRVAHGFQPAHSIFSNAAVHIGRKYVLNVDLKDFFGSIHFGRVRGFFIANNDFRLQPPVATILAHLICDAGALPQGAPTSPIVSNLIGHVLDMRLSRLAKANCCSYTRYADDLTFSTSLPTFPKALARPDSSDPSRWSAGKELAKEIARCGFSLNPQKTRLQLRRSRQDVTGIVVNERLSVRADYRRSVRAMVHSLRTKGTFELTRSQLSAGATSAVKIPGTLNQLEGAIAFLRQADYEHAKRLKIDYVKLSPAERVQRRFVFYRRFAAAPQGTLLLEGPTDSIYLREALRKLAGSYPSLATLTAGKLTLAISLYKPTKQQARLTGLSGGSADYVKFLQDYLEDFKHIKAPSRGANPLVILLDNDSGADPVLKFVKGRFGVAPISGKHWFHVTDNLYICLTGPPGGPPHCIEDLFDPSVLSHKIGGKSFSKSNKLKPATEYGKVWLAEKVVKPNAATIDFDKFKPLLADLEALIKDHAPGGPKPVPVAPAPALAPVPSPPNV